MHRVSETGCVTGQVCSLDGAPIQSASIYFNSDDPPYNAVDRSPMPRTTTDADGRFLLKLTAYYRLGYRLIVSKSGMAKLSIPLPSVFPFETLDLGKLSLGPGQILRGQVRNQEGHPIGGVRIIADELIHTHGNCVDAITDHSVFFTDQDGRFESPHLMLADATTLKVFAAGYVFSSIQTPVREIARPLALPAMELIPDCPCKMQFVDASGAPVSGVEITWIGYFSADEYPHPLTSDSLGLVELYGFKAGTETSFRAFHDDFLALDESFIIANRAEPFTFVMERRATLSGTVRDEATHELVEIARIQMCSVSRTASGEVEYSSCTLADFEQPIQGHFEILSGSTSEKHLEVAADGYDEGEIFVAATDILKNIRDISVLLKRSESAKPHSANKRKLVGHVTYQGKKIENGWVARWEIGKPAEVHYPTMIRGRIVDSKGFDSEYTMLRHGTFELMYRPTNDCRFLVVEVNGFPLKQVQWSELVINNEIVEIELDSPSSISGQVIGVPRGFEGNIWVVAFTRTGLHFESQVDTQGRFTFKNLGPGIYGLKAGHGGMRDTDVAELDDEGEPVGYPKGALAIPWNHAVVVEVKSGQDVVGVTVSFPQNHGE